MISFVSAPSFSETTAEKLGKSKRTVEHEVQIAARIPETIQEQIKDLPVANNKSDLLKIARSLITEKRK